MNVPSTCRDRGHDDLLPTGTEAFTMAKKKNTTDTTLPLSDTSVAPAGDTDQATSTASSATAEAPLAETPAVGTDAPAGSMNDAPALQGPVVGQRPLGYAQAA